MDDPVERQIREAVERGDFDHLPGSGRPLPPMDVDPAWWARRQVERQRAEDRYLEARRAADRALGAVWALPDEEQVRNAVAELDSRLERLAAAAGEPFEPLGVEAIVADWRRMSRARHGWHPPRPVI